MRLQIARAFEDGNLSVSVKLEISHHPVWQLCFQTPAMLAWDGCVTLFTEALPGKGRNRNQPAGQQSRKASTSVDAFTLWNRTEPKTRRAWPHLRVKPKESRSWSRYSWLLGVNYSSPLTGRYSSLANTTVMHGLLLVELYSDQPPSPTFPHSSRASCTCLKKPQR